MSGRADRKLLCSGQLRFATDPAAEGPVPSRALSKKQQKEQKCGLNALSALQHRQVILIGPSGGPGGSLRRLRSRVHCPAHRSQRGRSFFLFGEARRHARAAVGYPSAAHRHAVGGKDG